MSKTKCESEKRLKNYRNGFRKWGFKSLFRSCISCCWKSRWCKKKYHVFSMNCEVKSLFLLFSLSRAVSGKAKVSNKNYVTLILLLKPIKKWKNCWWTPWLMHFHIIGNFCHFSFNGMIFNSNCFDFSFLSFIGEEATSEGAKCELTDSPTWIIDPVDGTMNFVHSFPHSCISIALLVNRFV